MIENIRKFMIIAEKQAFKQSTIIMHLSDNNADEYLLKTMKDWYWFLELNFIAFEWYVLKKSKKQTTDNRTIIKVMHQYFKYSNVIWVTMMTYLYVYYICFHVLHVACNNDNKQTLRICVQWLLWKVQLLDGWIW